MFTVTVTLAKQGMVPGTKSMLDTVAAKSVMNYFAI